MYGSGGLGDYGGALSISGSDISHDTGQYYSAYGGGIYYDTALALSVTGSSISKDSGGYGGGVDLAGSGTVSMTQDTFAGDASTYEYGGGLYDGNSAAVTLTGDTFAGDSAYYGGGIYFQGHTQQLTNDTFDGNSGYEGGSLYLDTAGVTLTNDTIAHGNGNSGGGIYAPGEASAIVNTIVAENQGGDCFGGPAGTTADQGNNLDSDGSCFATGVPVVRRRALVTWSAPIRVSDRWLITAAPPRLTRCSPAVPPSVRARTQAVRRPTSAA